ncbi:hypothetical protein C5167_007237 [Papaver somniferum]|nr:hypothetical protein C5167_007237 [Papaver somniferum]
MFIVCETVNLDPDIILACYSSFFLCSLSSFYQNLISDSSISCDCYL